MTTPLVIDVPSEVFEKLALLAELSGLTPAEWLLADVQRAARICESFRDPITSFHTSGGFRPVEPAKRLSENLSVKVPVDLARKVRSRPDWPDEFRSLLNRFVGES